jgi:hypothetical protein
MGIGTREDADFSGTKPVEERHFERKLHELAFEASDLGKDRMIRLRYIR